MGEMKQMENKALDEMKPDDGMQPLPVQQQQSNAGNSNGILVEHNGVEVPIYRGGGDFNLKSGEFQVKSDKATFPVRGLSLTVDKTKASGFGGAFKIQSIPSELKMIPTPSKNDPGHFDIIPVDPKMTQEKYQGLLNEIKTIKI